MAKFNPYHKWLNLDSQITAPNYYRLLGLEDLEEDPEVIQAAAAATLARVQSCDPGSRTKRWSQLVAEVEQAGKCLTDEWTKGDYDRQLDLSVLAAPQPVTPDPSVVEKNKSPVAKKLTSRFEIAPETANLEASLLPPGMGGASMVAPEKPQPTPEPPSDTIQDAVANTGDNAPLVFRSVPENSVIDKGVDEAVGFRGGDLDAQSPDDKPVSDPVRAPVTFNEISAPQSRPDGPDVGDVIADPVLPDTNPMSAYQAPDQVIQAAPQEASGELSTGDIPLATTLSSHELQDVPIAQPTAGADVPRVPVEVTSSTPPPPARKRASQQRGRQLGIAAGLAVCIGILAFAWLNTESPKSGPVARRSPADGSRTPATDTESDPQPSDPQPSDPQSSDPQSSDPQSSDPQSSDPQPSDPQPSDPQPPDPQPPDPQPSDPQSSDPQSSDPQSSDPQPSDPQPSDPQPSDPQPSDKQQLANLGQALGLARAALSKGGVKSSERAAARKHLKQAAALAQLPQHKDLVRRLGLLANYVDQFWATLDRVVRGFQGGEELQYKGSIILVREKPQDELKIRYKGLNLSHRLNQLPPGIVMAIANHGFDETQPVNLVLKGAFLVVHPTASESMIADARRWWEEAANNDVEIGDLAKVIDDDYLLKLPATTE